MAKIIFSFFKKNPEKREGRFIIIVDGIDEIYLGHTIVKEHTKIDNCHYIDVGSSFTKKLCIVKIQ